MTVHHSTDRAAGVFVPLPRADFECDLVDASDIGDIQRKLPFWERLVNNDAARRFAVLAGFLLLWEGYALFLDNPLLFPRFSETFSILLQDLLDGKLIDRTLTSMQPLLIGYAGGIILAAILTTLAVSSRIGADLLSTLTAMFNPLPAIALLPLALLWFGLGQPAIVFVIVNSVLWAVALNTHVGCMAVSMTLRMAGQTFGLKGFRYVVKILMPAAFPAILSGLKIGWAFAWRTLIAAELVFGVSSGSGGLGWFIFENRNLLDTASVFAGLLTVMAVGLFVEGVIFRTIESKTVRRWGMQQG